MSINRSEVAVQFAMPTWRINPGCALKNQFDVIGRSKENPVLHEKCKQQGEKIYKRFINEKIPIAKELINELIQNRNISEVHLPLTLNVIFSVFIDELVEHYQNQLEQRDSQIDLKLLEIKRLLAKNWDLPWANNSKELTKLFNELKGKLILEEALPLNFDRAISLWKEILTIPNMGGITLAALYEKTAAIGSLYSEKKEEDTSCATYLSRSVLEQAFLLLLRQLSKDSIWVFQEMHEKIPVIDDRNLELDLRKLTSDMNHPEQFKQPASALVQEYVSAMRKVIDKFVSLNIDEIDRCEAFNEFEEKLNIAQKIVCTQRHPLQEWKSDEFKPGIDGSKIKLTDTHVFHLQNYFFASSLKNAYLSSRQVNLLLLLSAICRTNVYWKQFQETSIKPCLISQISPLLPAINSYDQSEVDAWIASLDAPETKSKTSQLQNTTAVSHKPKKKNRNQKKQVNVVAASKSLPIDSTKKLKTPSSNSVDSSLSSTKTNRIEVLRNKLRNLHQTSPSKALRQAIWHLESLISIHKSLSENRQKTLDFLAIADAVTCHAQKVLEQTYRFCIKDSEELSRTHNLKTYHRKFDPNYKSYPSVVRDLFLANTWNRYFYTEHEKWHSLTTGVAKVPSILDTLFEVAEGRGLTSQQLEELVSSTVENVCLHIEYLLREQKVPNSELPLYGNGAMELKEPVSLKVFDSVENDLKNLLVASKLSPHHPVYLSIKQVLAALKMQKTSLEKMSTSKDVYELSTWTVWSLQQLQESVEGVLHAIEYLQDHEISVEHELKTLAKKVKLDMGPLEDAYQNLSYKVRYPAEVLIDSVPAQIIDDLEAFKQRPEIMDGFKIQGNSTILWAKPSDGVSPDTIVAKLNKFMAESEKFLRVQAVPALEKLLTSSFNSASH